MNDEVGASGVWTCVSSLLGIGCGLFGLLPKLGFVYHLGRSSNYGALFVLSCLVRPVLVRRIYPSIMEERLCRFALLFKFLKSLTARIIETTNPHYLRIQALKGLVEKQFRSDILSGNIVQYIIDR